ncbi:MAG: DJ-1/PfpI family protein [Alphaproteobacteria bacterium]|nr:DJ-1/PfpI family protein [Alphaproteobacteria bacterium]
MRARSLGFQFLRFGVVAVVAIALIAVAAVFAMFPNARPVSAAMAIISESETNETLAALKPTKRARPVIAVVGDNRGSETTDYLIPYGVLKRSGVADVIALGMRAGPVKLMPALTIIPDATVGEFDRRYPDGADYVIVPAMHVRDDPAVQAWLKKQAARGATIVGICAGGIVLAEAGLLHQRRATTHWFWIDTLRGADATIQYVPDRRYVADRGVATTTGISASVPVSLAIVAAIAGRARADALAQEIGAANWHAEHDSRAFGLTRANIGTYAANLSAFWRHETLGIPVAEGVDDIALALMADAYSNTHLTTVLTLAENGAPVATKYGLRLVPDGVVGATRVDAVQPVLSSEAPARAIDVVLAQIGARYGQRSADISRLELEYPVRQADRSADARN